MAVKQPNMKAADSPIVMKAGDTAARETAAQKAVEAEINAYFADRTVGGDNEMTGLLEGKNVILK